MQQLDQQLDPAAGDQLLQLHCTYCGEDEGVVADRQLA